MPELKWDFLKPHPDPDGLTHEQPLAHDVLNDFKQAYVPVGPPVPVPYHTVNSWLRALSPNRRLPERVFSASISTYLVPDSDEMEEQMAGYISEAIGITQRELPNLSMPRINLGRVEKGDNFREGYHGWGFIGHSIYEVLEADILAGERRGVIEIAKPEHGSFANTMRSADEAYDSWHIVFSTGPLSLVAAFSEPIHLSTWRRAVDELSPLGKELVQAANEAIAEGISHCIARKSCNGLRVPGGEEFFDSVWSRMKGVPNYKYTQKAIDWMKDNGTKAALDLYMESPTKFLKAIGCWQYGFSME